MKYQKSLVALALIASTGIYSNAQASLVDRGGGLLYDDVLNVTWLQDANYAKTSGYDADGRLLWYSAIDWAANLVYHDSIRNVDYSDWRLASNTPVNGVSFNFNDAVDGSTDLGYNITSPHNELSYMYYVNLGLKGYYSPAGDYQPDFGIFGNGTFNGVDQSSRGQNNVGLVTNLQANWYWSDGENEGSGFWIFFADDGFQTYNPSGLIYAWAVRAGDVAAAPVPGAVWLFGSGLIALLGLKRRGNTE